MSRRRAWRGRRDDRRAGAAGAAGGRRPWRADVRGATGACGRGGSGALDAAGGGRDVQAARRGRQVGLGRGPLAGSAAPPIRACQCRTKIGGAADPATSPVSVPVVVAPPCMARHRRFAARQGNRRGQKC